MNILSLFDGMSCGQLAINRLGIKYENYFASEIDKYAIQVTMANFPNTIQLGSVVNVDCTKLPKIDLLIGGSPCQSFSFAGKRKGMSTKDEQEILTLEHYLRLKEEQYEFEGQSYLFWEYMRILNEVKPKYFLLENVMMSEKWERVLSKAIGVNPIKINSSLLSAQNRERLYWTNIGMTESGLFGDLTSIIEQPKDKGILLKDILQDNPNSVYYSIDGIKNYTEKSVTKKINQINDTNKKSNSGNQPYQQDRIYDVNGISPALNANKSDLLIPAETDKIDEKYYLSQEQIEKVLDRTGVNPNIDEPKALDVYNKKIKEDGKSPTLTDPCHNNIRLIEPKYYLSDKAVDRIARHKNDTLSNQKSSTIHAGYYKQGGRDQQYVDEKYFLSEKMFDYFQNHNKRHEEKGTGFIWQPTEGDKKANCLRANASLNATDNTILVEVQAGDFRTDEGFRWRENGKTGTLLARASTPFSPGQLAQIKTYEIIQTVKVRKHEVDIIGLQKLLKDRKISISEISKQLNVKKTKVEHWFRTDNSFSIPDSEYWFQLKELLEIETTEFDNQICEFIEKVNVFEKSNRVYDAEGLSPTLTTTSSNEKILINSRIRRLTPTECERLQTVPDDYTNYVSDTQRYKMLGNGWTVDVIAHIFSYLKK